MAVPYPFYPVRRNGKVHVRRRKDRARLARTRSCRRAPRPPCAAPPPDPPLTCHTSHARTIDKSRISSGCSHAGAASEVEQCGADLDRVARRLAAAAAARREHYEREAAEHALAAAKTHAPAASSYRLAAGRECVRATDGCDYTISKNTEPKRHRTHCGPDREPPAPRPVELAPTDACEISRGQRLDPCGHRPRILLEIDRNSTVSSTKEPSEDDPGASKATPIVSSTITSPSSKVGLTTRIMESLNLKRDSKVSCSKSKVATHYTDEKTPSWCSSPPKPAAVAARCSKPSIVEQLRRRPGGTIGRRCSDTRNNSRCMHTSTLSMTSDKSCNTPTDSAATSVVQDRVKDSGKQLESVLRERSQHKEIARGRVVSPDGEPGSAAPGAGQLELRIPPAADSVRVRVALDFVPLQTGNCMVPVAITTNAKSKTSNCTRSLSSVNDNSWLSIRNIQKKWSGYCKNNKPPTCGKSAPDRKAQMQPTCAKNSPSAHPKCGPPDVSRTSNKKTCDNTPNSNKSSKEFKPKPPCGCPPGKNIRRVSSALHPTPIILF
ncbi:uncharacterized protein [Epargyreus clarus]|uniref:uncharacterized protein n=1 Tax=Epargyreus clarus TaxID=520877 RepID=UPI003C30DAC0